MKYVCSVGDLADRIAEDGDLAAAVGNASIDTFHHSDAGGIHAVRKLNETGDAAAYWRVR